MVGLLIRLGRALRWGASDLLAVKLLLLHFHQDTIALHNDTEPVRKKKNLIVEQPQGRAILS